MKLKWLLQQFDAAVCVYVPRACNVPTHKVLKFSVVSINVKMWEVWLLFRHGFHLTCLMILMNLMFLFIMFLFVQSSVPNEFSLNNILTMPPCSSCTLYSSLINEFCYYQEQHNILQERNHQLGQFQRPKIMEGKLKASS